MYTSYIFLLILGYFWRFLAKKIRKKSMIKWCKLVILTPLESHHHQAPFVSSVKFVDLNYKIVMLNLPKREYAMRPIAWLIVSPFVSFPFKEPIMCIIFGLSLRERRMTMKGFRNTTVSLVICIIVGGFWALFFLKEKILFNLSNICCA